MFGGPKSAGSLNGLQAELARVLFANVGMTRIPDSVTDEQALQWAVQPISKAGTIGIIGVYPENMRFFPISKAMNKNLSINMGNCHHRRYIPKLMQLNSSGVVRPERVITQEQRRVSAIDAYRMFDAKKAGWMKVELWP